MFGSTRRFSTTFRPAAALSSSLSLSLCKSLSSYMSIARVSVRQLTRQLYQFRTHFGLRKDHPSNSRPSQPRESSNNNKMFGARSGNCFNCGQGQSSLGENRQVVGVSLGVVVVCWLLMCDVGEIRGRGEKKGLAALVYTRILSFPYDILSINCARFTYVSTASTASPDAPANLPFLSIRAKY